MGIDPTDARPTYRQIADQLRDQIHFGELRPGQRLPSERALADRYGVGPMTVRQATRTLQQEGLLDAQPGRGLFVRERRPLVHHVSADYLTDQQSWRDVLSRQGHTGGQRIREVAVVTPPPEIAALLGLSDDDPVLVRRRLLLIGDDPVLIADSYYPHRLVEGTPIAGSEPVTAGLLRSLEAAGVTLDRAEERWTTRMPTPSEASLLRLRPGVPVLRQLQTLYDTSGAAVCVTDNILAGDRHAFLFETAIGRPSSAQDAGSG
ncbi:MAG: GntR family transcriptional regulator [Egibacteraceae bacterium]